MNSNYTEISAITAYRFVGCVLCVTVDRYSILCFSCEYRHPSDEITRRAGMGVGVPVT